MTKTIKFPGTRHIGDMMQTIRSVAREREQEGFELVSVCIRRISVDGTISLEFLAMPHDVAPSKVIIIE